MCQLRDEEKANLLCELRDAVARLDALQPRPQPKYAPEELPNFLKERIPRFKKNLDLQPLITHTAVGDIRFTSDVEKVNAQSDDPNVKYALVPGAGNPFAPAYSLSDSLCEDFCNQAMAAEKMRTGRKSKPAFVPKPFCMTQEPNDAPRDPSGHIYDCEHNKMYEGISICNPHGHSQSYLCTEHVYPRK
ncbi:hypothetical protein GE061_015852 [Apolygus lucorum]|uniref:Uncharacterized protein n=1 Tax=Apolygus lucorum TaxID=248454 RepID=A0A8S9XPZ5_APOLU|nr:hypothetical protein GE061_015852 [Apolygus lucorum]